MSVSIPTHDYEPAIKENRTCRKVGEVSILWGIIKYPKIITRVTYRRLNFCRYCGEKKKTTIHGFYKLDQNG